MAESTADAQSVWLAQTSAPAQGADPAPQATGDIPADVGAAYDTGEAPGADYENGVIPGAEGAPASDGSAATGTPEAAQTLPTAPGTPSDQPVMDGASIPPPPAYGGDGAQALPGGAPQDPVDQAVMPGQDAVPQSGSPTDAQLDGQMGTEGQVASTGVPDNVVDRNEPPLGLLPIIVFGLAAVIGLSVYLSRRGKNWQEIGETIRSDDGVGGAQPESRMMTQFSEIHDMGGTRHTQTSAQVSNFD